MTNLISTLESPLIKGLACAALTPGLRSILIFDGSFSIIQTAAQVLTQLLTTITDSNVTCISLGTTETEDALWGSLQPTQELDETPFGWQAGLLTAGLYSSNLRVVIVPDITRLNLATARACVALIGADTVHLERHGQHELWQPNLCWIAGCSTNQVGMVSPHLLDRFALRLNGQTTDTLDRVTLIEAWLDNPTSEITTPNILLSSDLKDSIKKAYGQQPEITEAAISALLDYGITSEANSSRRGIALARLACATAKLEAADQIKKRHVDIAAQLIELCHDVKLTDNLTPKIPSSTLIDPESTLHQDKDEAKSTELPESLLQEQVYASDWPAYLPTSSLPISIPSQNPYPEDEALVQREATSLRFPTRRRQLTAAAHGSIIGVEPTTTAQDLALVSTFLTAAKFQPIRRKYFRSNHTEQFQQNQHNSTSHLLLSTKDLRRYRRAPAAEQMLVLVLDYTCLFNCNWQEALLPYLSWAYIERASVCLIQVGAASEGDGLKAEKITAPSVLVPRISSGIEAMHGNATPLAHGLDLALQSLRHALQHGRSTVQQAILLVISDGRGNVPLEASRANQKPVTPVKRQGIEDALQIAKQIHRLNDVKAVLLNPQPKQYPDLPLELAEMLGAAVISIPAAETGR